ncbi:hypothetical protein Vafri_4419 [Volvox africanus]|uniref:UDENN domain-containing protein n=2 Tax=Volvox africanus TaxID=51714 RepID=A0A8J4AUY6_9CHLO|nr:hypothetical protein Vafri_4419 [Volvox africanus]
MYLLFFVSRLRVESRSKTPVIYLRYKAASDGCEGVDFKEQLLNAFCFPLGPESVQPKEVQASEEYTFTLTHKDGQRFTGFCRQFFPPAPAVGSKARYPQVLCIVAENPWCNFFFKVLQVAEQLLKGFDGLLDSANQELPLGSHLGAFIMDLRKQLATNPGPGKVLSLTAPNSHGLSGVSPPRYMGGSSTGEPLNWGNDCIELQVPPDCGNGKDNSGIPLARLLFHVPVEGMLTLVASLLLERRIVFVARSRDTVTAAVQAAQALIYPFKWHHIYLPILPRDLVDYLSAPMPFLVGLTQEMLPLIRHIPMSEVTTVDLDLQKVSSPPGSQSDDGRSLPYGRQLGAALEAVFKTVRSPTEYESSPLITGVMQEYFVRLFGSYRRYIHEQLPEPLLRALPSTTTVAGQATVRGGSKESGRGHKEGREGRVAGLQGHAGNGDSTLSPQAPPSASRMHDEMLRGHGYYFDQPAFVAHRRSEAVRSFLSSMRHSQLYEMFIQERLAMAASGEIELPSSSGSNGQSFSYATGGAGAMGTRVPRTLLNKSNSANNLTSLERSEGSAYGPGSIHASNLTCHGPSAAGPVLQDPFELRVERYPERRRLLREHLRSIMGEAAAPGAAGGSGKLASKLRRHRRTDSEDLMSQLHAQPFGSFQAGESMRRITTYPGFVDLSTPTLEDPFNYFADWDLHEDDDASGSSSPSPRDREHKRSESGISVHAVDAVEPSGANSSVPPVAASGGASFAFSSRADRGGRERDGGRDTTPLRRLSVPMLSTNAKSTYMSLRAAPLNESPGPEERAGPAAAAVVPAGASGAGARMINIFHANGGGGGHDPPIAATVLKGGVQVVTLVDGHRVYDGNFKDILRLAATEAKNNLLSGLSGLASPLGSPRTKERETAAERRARGQLQHHRQLLTAFAAAAPVPPPHHFGRPPPQQGSPLGLESGQNEGSERQLVAVGSIPLPDMEPAPENPVLGASSSCCEKTGSFTSGVQPEGALAQQERQGAASSTGGAGHHFSSFLAGSSLLSGLKEKVAGAGTKAKALGILPTAGYKPQTTGEKAAKFKAQLTGRGGATLLAGADGKLRQPHAPQRPLSLTGGPPPFLGRSDGSDMGRVSGSGISSHAPTSSFATPIASPGGVGTSSEAGAPVEVSPFAPPTYARAMSAGGIQRLSSRAAVVGGASAVVVPGEDGNLTPPTSGTLPVPGFTWRADAPYVPPSSDWDPFGTGSAPPAAASGATFSAASTSGNWSIGCVKGSVASATTSPFAASAHTPGTNVATAGITTAAVATTGASSADATTADLLGLSPSALSGVSSSFTLPAGSGFDPFPASDQLTQGRLESGGSNDFAAFASASSPREFPGMSTLGPAPVVS